MVTHGFSTHDSGTKNSPYSVVHEVVKTNINKCDVDFNISVASTTIFLFSSKLWFQGWEKYYPLQLSLKNRKRSR